MATLVCRPGDPQAIKAAASAALSGTSLAIVSHADSAIWKKLASNTAGPFGQSCLFLILADGTAISEANSMVRSLGSSTATTLDIESWVEWEEHCLRPAVYSSDSAALQAALQQLSAVVQGRKYLSGSELSIADVVVYATLRPLHKSQQLIAPVGSYLTALGSEQAVASAEEQVLQGQPADVISTVFLADAAAFKAQRPKLPVPGQRNILITSALPYVNNVPHLGNIIGCVLSADVYARFCRARGYNCIYICGTDEYGTATETKALEEGLSCQEICDKYHAIHKGIYEWFDISFDKFGRTPTRAQTQIGQEIFQQLRSNGFLVEQTMEQLYSEPINKFLADRFVVGTCPKCKYEDARGDQCDACGTLLNPTELINPKCKITGATPVVRQTKHIFLDLPKLTQDLQSYVTTTSQQGGWSSNCVQVTNAWMSQGLKVRCITRDLKWGTPVPLEGYQDKVFYVWFDAPIGYISITANYCSDWKAWWMNPQEVEMVQFMGKDNVPFHTVIFPSTLLGTRQPWTMMKSISVTEYLNYEDGKFSKSRGVGVFGNDAKDTGIPAEVWRYYLLAVRPESQDSAFQWDDFAAKANSELNDNLGNFINRTLKFLFARFDRTVPGPVGEKGSKAVQALGERVAPLVQQYITALEAQKMRDALRCAMMVAKAGNAFFQDTQIWVVIKSDKEECSAYISACAGIATLLAALLQPFMPSFTAKLLAQLNLAEALPLTDDLIGRASNPATLLPAGHQISATEPKPLFDKITDAQVAELRARYAGNQADRAQQADASSTSAAAAGGGGGKKGQGPVKQQKQNGGKPGSSEQGGAAVGENGEKKQKEDKKAKGEKAAAGGGGKKEEREVDISRVDLRVGLIRKAWKHPDAESLYVEEVDAGEAEPRTVVSGLVKFIPEADMQQRRVVLVCNLKPANMRGVKSQAMVLAATSDDGEKVELVEPPAGAAVGERVFVEGYPGEPDEQLNPKKKIWEAVHPDLATSSKLVACYKGKPLQTAQGPCTVKSVVGASIK